MDDANKFSNSDGNFKPTQKKLIMRKFILWTLAVIITLAAAVYQKMTGPTHEARGKITVAGATYKYDLIRAHGGETDAPISITISDQNVSGVLVFKHYNVDEEWTEIPLKRTGEQLAAELPHQPPAGKLEYYLKLTYDGHILTVPDNEHLVIRFRGAVPAWALLPHILLIFTAMLVSTRAGLEALSRDGKPRNYALWAAGLLFLGGMIFGPIMQKFAFGEFWTGVPFGWDLTDNKTLIAMIGWIIAVIAGFKDRPARLWVAGASLLLMMIFSIPHSMMGSELDYETGEVVSSGIGK
ncbi:hypothetical protein CEE37_01695 [candidate division LCP-89 bacterium B3_LCP]|uniref:Uncharacterized protein n=1 Tax=candidate division LCP-89 bacterium B3_LCP TaxID=2012998 RepID=A0A532V5F6_UNCL8|nr:MAG: hypothetical protein CEE37_01695 [candidate division LCP-89 bacterium B3_LCP]